MTKSAEQIALNEKYGARNYKPLPIVIAKADRVWVWDCEGNKYMDMLSAYSALNQGHRHPRIIKVLREQADRVTLTSRAFHNDQLGPFLKVVCEITGMEMTLPMNTGAEAVETAIKAARKWGYTKKGIAENQAEIIVCSQNFHGRTTTIVSFSSDEEYRSGFGPFTPGFKIIPYGDIEALQKAVTRNTCAFLVEPIQGEAGVVVPAEGYLRKASAICRDNRVLFMADEIQTGFGRTGKLFACDHEGVKPDVYILGKALGAGVMPVSAVAARAEVLGVFEPGQHGSTFGGNPLACAVAREAVKVILEEKLPERSAELGAFLKSEIEKIAPPYVEEIRGKGLFIGIVLKKDAGGARRYCEALMKEGILAKETHHTVIRLAPPLVITKEELVWAIERIAKVLS